MFTNYWDIMKTKTKEKIINFVKRALKYEEPKQEKGI
jgi:hypothetical protein